MAVVITAAEKEEVRRSIKSETEWVNPNQVLLEPKPKPKVLFLKCNQTVVEVWYVCCCYAVTVSLFREE